MGQGRLLHDKSEGVMLADSVREVVLLVAVEESQILAGPAFARMVLLSVRMVLFAQGFPINNPALDIHNQIAQAMGIVAGKRQHPAGCLELADSFAAFGAEQNRPPRGRKPSPSRELR